MKFFVPGKNDTEADELLEAVTSKFQSPRPALGEHIRRVDFEHNGEKRVAEVGSPFDAPTRNPEEPMLLIIRHSAQLLYAFTASRLPGGPPIMIGDDGIFTQVTYFD